MRRHARATTEAADVAEDGGNVADGVHGGGRQVQSAVEWEKEQSPLQTTILTPQPMNTSDCEAVGTRSAAAWVGHSDGNI